MPDAIRNLTFTLVEIATFFGAAVVAILVVWVAIAYVIDITQKKHAIRRNFPVIGRFRYFFEHLGEFFRQYFFAMDREELPFNRAERAWVYRSAKNVDNTVAFGSTRNLTHAGEVIFLNCPFPTLEEDAVPPREITLGEGFARTPYSTSSIFNISGMSYGAISRPAVLALSHGAKEAGVWMNTGEGGLTKYHLEGGCDLVFQIGTAKYGARTEEGALSDEKLVQIAAHEQVRMFEIKMSQGAKPGKGGILPGGKVTQEIAAIRGIPEGKSSISPNGHPEIRNVDDLIDMIHHIREVTGKPVGFKAVIGAYGFLDTLFKRIHERGLEYAPDFITIDSADGGTGAAPQSLIDYVGLTIKESLPLVVDKLMEYGLRHRIKVICSGKLITPSGVAWALCMGADFIVSARGYMFALGCIQALQCNKNTCPTGVTTHDPELQKGLDPANKAVRVANYAKKMAYEVGVIAHSCGVREPRELRRYHAHIITDSSFSTSLETLFPTRQVRPEYAEEVVKLVQSE
ncbi:Glutamate synthase domain 2 [Hahella chejuensis KCTC 2396]|uniref:Glutamate synthase domain 2 n=1 Tax=Hahella chejuensis (strain KCTC 2396) TaxID=349521 RepID=Q2SQ31_HAHCH|nr:FMN-binding glutamate synthase family protein [Hahella chejuensis]ABC27243.1 Glutamate synthase domain 2 [Hahella chejuensis KCTC 2396]